MWETNAVRKTGFTKFVSLSEVDFLNFPKFPSAYKSSGCGATKIGYFGGYKKVLSSRKLIFSKFFHAHVHYIGIRFILQDAGENAVHFLQLHSSVEATKMRH